MKRLFLTVVLMLFSAVCLHGQQAVRSTSVVVIDGVRYHVHTVRGGETIGRIADIYGVEPRQVREDNPSVAEPLQEGDALKVRTGWQRDERLTERRMRRVFDQHTVNQGETLYSISRRYEVPVAVLMEDNPELDPAKLSIGEKINIRKASVGTATAEEIDRQMEEYRDAVNLVADSVQYHYVEKGETLYGLARRYGVSEESIVEVNNLAGDLRAGAMIVIPAPAGTAPVEGDGGETEGAASDSTAVEITKPWELDRADAADVRFRNFSLSRPLKVALLLPLKDEGQNAGKQFLEFYRGVLLAMEDIKAEGLSVKLDVYNTGTSEEEVGRIVSAPEFEDTDIIIGPVYEDDMAPALRFAERTGAAVVSPLAGVDSLSSPALFQVAPDEETKYEKLREVFEGDKNIVLIRTKYPDEEMENAVTQMLPEGYRTLDYSGNIRSTSFSGLTDRKQDNVFIISCTNEHTLDQILAGLSSMQNNVVSRGMVLGDIRVVGSSRWSRFGRSLDMNLFFKLKVCYPASYHATRSSAAVRAFDNRYIGAYGVLPNLYSYRGYDVAKLFVGATAAGKASYADALNSFERPMLLVEYEFRQKERHSTYVNVCWPLVCYNSDYTVEIK